MKDKKQPITKNITSLEVGGSVSFPIERTLTVRQMILGIQLKTSNRYSTETDREAAIVRVIRKN